MNWFLFITGCFLGSFLGLGIADGFDMENGRQFFLSVPLSVFGGYFLQFLGERT